MEGLTELIAFLDNIGPIASLFLGVISFITGFIGGMLKQKFTEGKIKGEIDTKFLNAGRKIEAMDNYIEAKMIPRIVALEASASTYEHSLKACQNVQQERFNTRQAELISSVKTMITDEFKELETRMATLREKARKEKREELEELKLYVEERFALLVNEKANSL